MSTKAIIALVMLGLILAGFVLLQIRKRKNGR